MDTTTSRLLLSCIFALTLGACADGGSNNRKTVSIDTANADRCEILDQANCMFPWPSSAFTVEDDSKVTGRRVNLNQASLPANKQGVRVDPTQWNRNDGFSPSQMILAQVPGVDLAKTGAPPITDIEQSLGPDSPVVVMRASTGEPHLVFAELDANTSDPAEQTFIIRPMIQFERGERYIVALRTMRNAAGEILEAPEVFRALRDNTLTDNAAIEDRRPAMEEIFRILGDAGIAREELYLAWDFNIASVENITERVLHIRDDAFASLGNAAPQFSVTEVKDLAPCDETGCKDGQDPYKSRTIIGTFEVPNYLDSDDGVPGSYFYYAEPDDGLPDRIGGDNLFTAKFYCSIARSVAEDFSAPPKAPARPSLYGHGLLGSGDEALRGTGANINIMANDHQMMFCGTDWSGFAEEDIGYAVAVLQEWTLLGAVFDRQQQGFLNFMYLARLLKHDNGLRSHPAFQAGGVPVFDNSDVYYDGNSQGGILGGALMGVIQDVTRGVLGVPGMSYSR
ncbi:MAG: hypothetical protein KA135_07075, partial [Halioglobus sp.]|nr:hypothetical protein [Halioglobus sp.]